MREIKFRGWDKELNFMINIKRYKIDFNGQVLFDNNDKELYNQTNKIELMQYTGLKDKNGVEIYEYMEIDNTYEVSFLNGSYVLTNISNGDIMLLSNYMENNNGKVEITREYTKV